MARRKQVNPVQRIPSGDVMLAPADIPDRHSNTGNDYAKVAKNEVSANGSAEQPAHHATHSNPPGLTQLAICVLGIYASFLSWALLQERITKTPFKPASTLLHPNPDPEYFQYPVVLNTIQSLFASITGSIYLSSTTSRKGRSALKVVFPTKLILVPLVLVSITSSLASPFGYASLAHVDYLTYILAKSCKLLPVMFLHLTIFRKRYPLYKYGVVAAVTLGVALFTLHHPSTASKKSKTSSSSAYGLVLLSINLLFDGLTNTIQDHVFSTPSRYGFFSGPQMMVAQNLISTFLTSSYLLLTPILPPLPLASPSSSTELSDAISFLTRNPSALHDALGFAACGAIGQIFIYMTLNRFGSILLVTVTVTRKMLSMLLSVLWFGKSLSRGQWLGVGLVFGAVGVEGWIQRKEKLAKQKKQIQKKSG